MNRLLLVAAALAALAIGLPWSRSGSSVTPPGAGLDGVLLGTQHPVRVLAVLGAVAVWAALRRGSRPAALAAVALAATALPLGGWPGSTSPGQVCFALALLTAGVALRRPARRSRRRLGGPAGPIRPPGPAVAAPHPD